VLFGSMFSNSEHLADVDIAVELEPKIADEAKFGEWCDARRRLALKIGARFSNTMDWEYWPQMEVFQALRARSRALSLHEWNQIIRIPGVRYSVLSGDRQRISGMISTGECVDHSALVPPVIRTSRQEVQGNELKERSTTSPWRIAQ
jgi:hypothetical protein